jgi:hypothetical protein
MSRLAIEFNDAGLLVADAERVISSEPGYALVGPEGVVTGDAALRAARLRPAQVSNRHWYELGADMRIGATAGMPHAEIAYRQLAAMWAQSGQPDAEAVFVVPGHYGAEQLGLLLGLAEECGIAVRTMVDVAVASSTRAQPDHDLYYLDAGLHHVLLVHVEQERGGAVLGARHTIDSGVASVNDALIKALAERFVLETRFDPLHHASSEQAMYDRLPGWMAALESQSEIVIALPHGDGNVEVAIDPQRMRQTAAAFNRAVLQLVAQHRRPNRPIVLQVGARLAAVPGLVQELARLDEAQIVVLDAGHAAMSALRRLEPDSTGREGVSLLKRLPFSETAGQTVPPPRPVAQPHAAPARADVPTHVVYRGIAYGLERGPIVVGREATEGQRTIVVDSSSAGISRAHCEIAMRNGELRLRDLSRFGTFVNEQRIDAEAVLKPADVIRIGSPGAELHVVALESSRGA